MKNVVTLADLCAYRPSRPHGQCNVVATCLLTACKTQGAVSQQLLFPSEDVSVQQDCITILRTQRQDHNTPVVSALRAPVNRSGADRDLQQLSEQGRGRRTQQSAKQWLFRKLAKPFRRVARSRLRCIRLLFLQTQRVSKLAVKLTTRSQDACDLRLPVGKV